MARIGFDVDGILTHFDHAYQKLVIATTGKDLFHPGDYDNPPCWNWPEYRGYSPEEVGKVWDFIKHSDTFWLNLGETSDAATLRMLIGQLEHQHDVYFVSSRPGTRAKRQTEIWLYSRLGYPINVGSAVWPTVCISSHKGDAAKALNLSYYIDDNLDNVWDVCVKSPHTATFLLNKSYNQHDDRIPVWLKGIEVSKAPLRVNTLGEMFDHELVII